MFKLGTKSEERLNGVHPDLVKVVREAIKLTPIDFRVIEGLRTQERQDYLFATGKTKVRISRHQSGYAVDVMALVKGDEWNFRHYMEIAKAFKSAAKKLDVPIIWGGDWVTFKDGPHFELPRDKYADKVESKLITVGP